MRSDKSGRKEPVKKGNGKGGGSDRSVGEALRQVYQDAVSENVPDEMLDLLKKLG